MFIQAVTQYNDRNIFYKNNKKITNPINSNINFKAVVDKGMIRFYDANASRLPLTLKNHLATITDLSTITPLQAQADAFKKLKEAASLKQIKEELFPDEPLFANLKNIEDTKATNGILNIYRSMREIYENGILNNGENFTIYLLKKIFLEAKTLDEINKDLEQDLDNDFKVYYKEKNPDTDFIHSTTLRALGIKLPDVAYLNSLKFTREGYSEAFGLKVSKGQQEFWNSLSEEDKIRDF